MASTDKDLAEQLFNEYMEALKQFGKTAEQILGQTIKNNKAIASALKQTSKVILK